MATADASAAALFTQASEARAAGKLDAAASGYAAAIRLRPDLAEAYLNTGWVLSELGRAEEAADAYAHGLRLRDWPSETAAAARNNLGVLLRDLGRLDDARRQWELAIEAKPDFRLALSSLEELRARASGGESFGETINAANEQFARGAHDEAIELYRAALPLRDARADGSAYVGLGAALHGARRVKEALEVLTTGAKLNPASRGMLQNLATVRSELGQYKGAASAWRKALTLWPDDADGYRSAFTATKQARGARAALPLLSHAARLDPRNWHHHYSAAHGYLHEAFCGGATCGQTDRGLASKALAALRPLHRHPISLRMRSEEGAEPPWTRERGRGLLGDE